MMNPKYFLIPIVGMFCLMMEASAQTLPSRASGAVKLQRYNLKELPSGDLRPVESRVNIPSSGLLSSPENLPDTEVFVSEFVLDGSSVYDQVALKEAVAPYENRTLSIAEIYEVANLITRYYQADDYVLSHAFVPEQQVTDGRVVIHIVEGGLGRVVIEGDVGGNAGKIRDYAQGILGYRPLKGADMERALMLMHDLPGIAIRSFVMPTAAGMENADLIIEASEKSHAGYAAIDNRGSDLYGQTEVYGVASFNGLLGMGELIEVEPFVSGPFSGPENIGLSFSARLPVSDNGAYVQGIVAGNRSKPGGSLETFDIEGEAYSVTLLAAYPIVRQIDQYLYGGVQLDVLGSEEDTAGAQFIEDNNRVLRANVNYAIADGFGGDNYADLTLSQGLDVLGATQKNDALSSRENAEADFWSMRAGVSRSQRLDDIADGLKLGTSFIGQYSNAPLPSVEEFGLGGVQYLEAYDDYEVSGDSGWAVKAKLSQSIGDGWMSSYNLNHIEPYVSVSYGQVFNEDPIDGEDRNSELTSLSGGVDFQFLDNYFASVSVAAPLSGIVAEEGNENLRVFFQLGALW